MDNQVLEEKILKIDKSKWKPTKLGTLAEDISVRVDKPGNSEYDRFVGLDNFISGDIKIKFWASTENLTSSAKAFKAGDILFARRNAYLRRASLVDFDGCCSGDAFVIRENLDKVVPGFLAFLMNTNTLWDYANSNAAGTMSKRVKWRDLAEYEFLLPPKAEQARLAELLWAMDEVIKNEKAVLVRLEKSKKTIIENRIIEFTANKDFDLLGNIGKWISGGTPSMKNKDFWEKGTVPWVTPKDMKSDYINETIDNITNEAVIQKKAKVFPKGKIVIVWRSGILQHTLPIARVEKDFAINQDLKVFIPTSNLYEEEFIWIFLNTHSEKIRRQCVKEGTTVQSISSDSFMKYIIPIIELDKQKKIIEEEKALENSQVNSLKLLKSSQSLQKSLINQIF